MEEKKMLIEDDRLLLAMIAVAGLIGGFAGSALAMWVTQ